MNSSMFSISAKDFVNGLVMAVGGTIYGVIAQALAQGTLDVFALDWLAIGKVALSAIVVYILKKFFSKDVNGESKVFGRIG